MHDQALLGPPGIERLIGLEVLVAVQRRPLVRLNERGVHVERRLRRRMLRLNRLQKIAVHCHRPAAPSLDAGMNARPASRRASSPAS